MLKGNLKKLFSLVALVLVALFALSACAPKTTDTSPDTSPDAMTEFKIGVNTWGSGVPILDMFGDNAQNTLQMLGCTVDRASDDFTAEKELTNVQNFISAGAQGIALQAAAVSTLPQMASVCADAEVPFVLFTFIGADEDRDVISENNAFYAGAVDADMITDGMKVAEMAYADGCRTAVLIGGNIGDNNMDQRSDGFREKFEELGGTVLDEARCTDPSETLTKAEDMLSANMEVDCIYAMVADYVYGSIEAIDNLSIADSINVYLSCVDKGSAEYIKEGRIAGGNDGITLASYIGPTLLLNYLDGHQILDENGNPPRLQTIPFAVTAENVDDYMATFTTEGVSPVTDEVLKSLCYRYNPDVTYQTYVELITSGLSLEAIVEAHA